jgi:hypothetical protein
LLPIRRLLRGECTARNIFCADALWTLTDVARFVRGDVSGPGNSEQAPGPWS